MASGNFGIGRGTVAEANAAGLEWVGSGYRPILRGKEEIGWISADGLRVYRFPELKKGGTWRANFESRPVAGQPKSNAHFDITNPRPR
jgi:hypothetical protein